MVTTATTATAAATTTATASARPRTSPSRWDELAVRGVQRGLAPCSVATEWTLSVLAGRFVEISGDRSSAALTSVFRLVHEAQRSAEPVAWVTRKDSVFFPPDVAGTGIDLAALPVVWVRGALQAARTADRLLRSGGFGLVVLDLGLDTRLPLHAQTRLVGLAKKHGTALLCLTEKEHHRPSLGSLVSLRAQATRTQRAEDRFHCEVQVLKDKRRGPGWTYSEVCRGPDGLH